ncbi:MAG TPA: hypothetical protein EYP04_08530, partial [Anaerolineae bacterium]|nr:hypothetical protein [Anaerolineae bacterium]
MIIDCETYYRAQPLVGKTLGLAGLIRQADEAGVDKMILMPEGGVRPKNCELAELLDSSPDVRGRFIPCAWLNPQFGDEAVRELEIAIREWGFRGLKLMPTHHNFRAVSSLPYPLMRKA